MAETALPRLERADSSGSGECTGVSAGPAPREISRTVFCTRFDAAFTEALGGLGWPQVHSVPVWRNTLMPALSSPYERPLRRTKVLSWRRFPRATVESEHQSHGIRLVAGFRT
jgi:hypothetical protein